MKDSRLHYQWKRGQTGKVEATAEELDILIHRATIVGATIFLRERMGWTQAEAAEACGYKNKNRISMWERMQMILSEDEIINMGKAYGLEDPRKLLIRKNVLPKVDNTRYYTPVSSNQPGQISIGGKASYVCDTLADFMKDKNSASYTSSDLSNLLKDWITTPECSVSEEAKKYVATMASTAFGRLISRGIKYLLEKYNLLIDNQGVQAGYTLITISRVDPSEVEALKVGKTVEPVQLVYKFKIPKKFLSSATACLSDLMERYNPPFEDIVEVYKSLDLNDGEKILHMRDIFPIEVFEDLLSTYYSIYHYYDTVIDKGYCSEKDRDAHLKSFLKGFSGNK